MLNQSTRVLLVYGKTKQMFFYDLVAFVFIYGALFANGFDEIKSFSFLLVVMENILATSYLIFILIRYTGFKSTLTFVVSILPLIVAAAGGKFASDYVRIEEVNVFVELTIVTVIFTITFFLILLGCYMTIFRKFSEWEYLFSLLQRSLNSVLMSLKTKN
jgi:hypothetical protein